MMSSWLCLSLSSPGAAEEGGGAAAPDGAAEERQAAAPRGEAEEGGNWEQSKEPGRECDSVRALKKSPWT